MRLLGERDRELADKRDYYEILGVSKTATVEEIKSAFRKRAKECHPDLHPGDKKAEADFKELNEAAEVLVDPEKRAKYDQYGHAAFDPSVGGQDPFAGGGFGGFGDLNDILGQMFGGAFSGGGFGGSVRNGPIPGDDLRYNLTITFEEAAFGVEKEISVPREEVCGNLRRQRREARHGANQVQNLQRHRSGANTAEYASWIVCKYASLLSLSRHGQIHCRAVSGVPGRRTHTPQHQKDA